MECKEGGKSERNGRRTVVKIKLVVGKIYEKQRAEDGAAGYGRAIEPKWADGVQ